MLVPFHTSGAKPPLYFIHGIAGVMPLGRFLAQSLGADQPLYAINANNFDQPEITVEDMASAYAEEILDSKPDGPVRIGGMCVGGLAALEVARELKARGRKVGPVILVDPPAVPQGLVPHNQTVNAQDPLVASQLYQQVRGQLLDFASRSYNDMPFVRDDEQQVHLATLIGVKTMIAFCRFVPQTFTDTAVAIVSLRRAANFFHPQMPWAKLLPRKAMVFVLPFAHTELFQLGRHDLARVLKFILDETTNFGTSAEAIAAPRTVELAAHELD